MKCISPTISSYSITIIFLITLTALLAGDAFSDSTPLCPECRGMCPGWRSLAITSDGAKAYIAFSFDDSLLEIDLPTFRATHRIDISEAGVMLVSGSARLTPDDSKLWVVNEGTNNILVVDTKKRIVEHVLQVDDTFGPMSLDCLHFTRDGTKAVITANGGRLYIFDTADYSFQSIAILGVYFSAAAPSPLDSNIMYGLAKDFRSPSPQRVFFRYDLDKGTLTTGANLSTDSFPDNVGIDRFVISPDGTRAYWGYCRLMNDRGYGNISAFDIIAMQFLSTSAIENGVQDFTLNSDRESIYCIGFWGGSVGSGTLPVIEWSTINFNTTNYLPLPESADMRSVVVNPSDTGTLYVSECDYNVLQKMDVTSGQRLNRLQFHTSEINPLGMTLGGGYGYIFCRAWPFIYKFNLRSGRIYDRFQLPEYLPGMIAGSYHDGYIFFNSGNMLHKMASKDGTIHSTFDIGLSPAPGSGWFTFFSDKAVMVDLIPGGMVGRRLIFFRTSDWHVLNSIDLPQIPYGHRVFLNPEGNKLYTISGYGMGSDVYIKIYSTTTLSEITTITIPDMGRGAGGATGTAEAAFDLPRRRVYITGFASTYAIDLDSDLLVDALHHSGVYDSMNRSIGWELTAPCGASISPDGNILLITLHDPHSTIAYDIANSKWLGEVLNLQGYYTKKALATQDAKYIYAIHDTDDMTMIDAATRTVLKRIPIESPTFFPGTSIISNSLLLLDP